MSYSRRQVLRLLRLRNLLLLTTVVMLLYLMRMLSGPDGHSPTSALLQSQVIDKIDWHDYRLINEERKRVGIGEQGKPATVPESYAELEKELYAANGFNGALSDLIPLNRSVPDIRHPKCAKLLYSAELPTVSVVVPFHNEHWSTLLRTVHSVLHRSPDKLIKEVFLVDDASTKDFLKDKLDEYLRVHMPRARVLRLAARSGLIAARLEGARAASADVLVFLDAHTEANVNWLPPLLEPIAASRRTVTCPYIDVVAHDTLQYRAQDEGARGAFDWELFYKRLPVLPKDEQAMPQPFESPVMAGGLFAISREFFWELGGYDPGLDIWGGEQYELSFKIWQCGGRMLDVPCSRVGHIYRKFPPFPNPGHGNFVGKNYRRVAEVWMDEYAEFLYARRPAYRDIDPGDIREQRALRTRLHCKPFKWFMKQIAFDLTARYPTVEPHPFASGRVRPVKDSKLCVDTLHGAQKDKLHIKPCSNSSQDQSFEMSWHKDIRSKGRNICWDLPEGAPRSPVLLYNCHLGGGNQLWRYNPETQKITHSEGVRQCLDYSPEEKLLFINPCRENADTQLWSVDHVDKEMMAKWNVMRVKVTAPEEYNDT